jgi:hypothetical protein
MEAVKKNAICHLPSSTPCGQVIGYKDGSSGGAGAQAPYHWKLHGLLLVLFMGKKRNRKNRVRRKKKGG